MAAGAPREWEPEQPGSFWRGCGTQNAPHSGDLKGASTPITSSLVLSPLTSFWAVATAHGRGHGAGVHSKTQISQYSTPHCFSWRWFPTETQATVFP